MNLKVSEIVSATLGLLIQGDPEIKISGIAIDSGKVKPGDIFVPIKGLRTDGHKYIALALENGAKATFTSWGMTDVSLGKFPHAPVIKVDDTTKALQRLGEYYRETYVRIPFIGVTGSTGKTSTKEMIARTCLAKYKVHLTKGNENSQLGVPITVLETPFGSTLGVIEMGISSFGEMARLSKIVRPDMAVITNIGLSHLVFLKTQENILLEKLHITDYMRESGILLLNGDDPLLQGVTRDFLRYHHLAEGKDLRIRFYGQSEDAYYRAVDYKETKDGLKYDFYADGIKACKVLLKVHGKHMMMDSLIAMACAFLNGVDPLKAAKELKGFEPLNGRGEKITVKGINLINDAYNASPMSMEYAILTFDKECALLKGTHALVLSDMLELGADEKDLHEEIGSVIAKKTRHVDLVLCYGELSGAYLKELNKIRPDIRGFHFDSYEELLDGIHKYIRPGDTMLIKGSNSMDLWKIPGDL